ncbi:MAG: YifB family Mg chelatase-like AAA ATPase, partial [Firmicutes bacterium]|nr:YifB family Mg chelatase-like AAA ATPase [Bacillota bacterium]
LQFPVKRIVVNLAPADTKKAGPSFDLPIALGILVCMGAIPRVGGVFVTGELSLNGDIRPVNGVLPMVHSAFKNGLKKAVVPFQNAEEACLVAGMEVTGARSLQELIEHFTKRRIEPFAPSLRETFADDDAPVCDFADVKGQDGVKRALEIAAAGYHNVIMIGPPGSGKTMMAQRLPSVMPDLTFAESMEITKIYSISGLLDNKKALVTRRPFRAPHHTASYISLTGGGVNPMPGEISLAHNGVLFLDELPEFQKKALETLRQPLEEGRIVIARASGTQVYPSRFMLVAAMNPCPCGYNGTDRCRCTNGEIAGYINKISGPLLDRIDLQVEAPFVKYEHLHSGRQPESSGKIKKRVMAALEVQKRRYKDENIRFNSMLSSSMIEKYCALGKEEQAIIKSAYNRLGMSARAYHKILRVSRTIADLDGAEEITVKHLAEAIGYRGLDRKYWTV